MLVLIRSNWDLYRMTDFLRNYLGQDSEDRNPRIPSEEMVPLRVIRRMGKETNRTLGLMPREVYEALIEDGYGYSKHEPEKTKDHSPITFAEYQLHRSQLPPETEEQGYGLFLPLPTFLSAQQVRAQLQAKLDALAKMGLMAGNDFKIRVPLLSRANGQHKGFAFVNFDRSLEPETAAAAKLMLQGSFWAVPYLPGVGHPTATPPIVKCFWSNRQTKIPPVA